MNEIIKKSLLRCLQMFPFFGDSSRHHDLANRRMWAGFENKPAVPVTSQFSLAARRRTIHRVHAAPLPSDRRFMSRYRRVPPSCRPHGQCCRCQHQRRLPIRKRSHCPRSPSGLERHGKPTRRTRRYRTNRGVPQARTTNPS